MPTAATGTVPSSGLLQVKSPSQAQGPKNCRCAHSNASERLSAWWLRIRDEGPLDRAVALRYFLSPTTSHLLPVTYFLSPATCGGRPVTG